MEHLGPGGAGLLICGTAGVPDPLRPSGAATPGTGGPPTGLRDLEPWHVVGVFGSEELSAMSPPVRELSPEAVVELHPEDATALRLSEDDAVAVPCAGGRSRPLRLNAGLARGTIALTLVREHQVQEEDTQA